MPNLHRRDLLATAACFIFTTGAHGRVISGMLPWHPDAATPPPKVVPGPWQFFTWAEGAAVEAFADRLIPPDPEFAGGKDAGCAVFIDRQLAGPYGRRDGWYNMPPFKKGTKTQGTQSKDGPAIVYRKGLAAVERVCRQKHNKSFVQLSDAEKDDFIRGLEAGTVSLGDTDGKTFFQQILKDVQDGFFSDPIYGGNKDMVAWRMIGFPGARYDYRDWIDRHNQRYPLPPTSIEGRAEWIEHRT